MYHEGCLCLPNSFHTIWHYSYCVSFSVSVLSQLNTLIFTYFYMGQNRHSNEETNVGEMFLLN